MTETYSGDRGGGKFVRSARSFSSLAQDSASRWRARTNVTIRQMPVPWHSPWAFKTASQDRLARIRKGGRTRGPTGNPPCSSQRAPPVPRFWRSQVVSSLCLGGWSVRLEICARAQGSVHLGDGQWQPVSSVSQHSTAHAPLPVTIDDDVWLPRLTCKTDLKLHAAATFGTRV
jgi:hypothetical protein